MCEVKEYVNIQNGEVLDLERVNQLKDNAMLKVKPELWIEWDFEKNSELGRDIWDAKMGSNKKAWWLCDNHITKPYPSCIGSKCRKNTNCPYCCHNPKTLKGFNDMWTTNPELASKLLNPEDGYKYTQSSGERVNWKCPNCKNPVNDRHINKVLNYGLSCKNCSDGWSYPEKVLYNILKNNKVEFAPQKIFSWLKGRKYDFYIPSLNMIIEVHGKQHYEETTRGRSLKEEQENDCIKYETAMKNGISTYIVIDARKSEIEWIKKSILNSYLSSLLNLNNSNWENIDKVSQKPIYFNIIKEWNEGLNVKEISKKLLFCENAIRNALHWGEKNDICNFSNNKFRGKKNISTRKPVVQLDRNMDFISLFDCILDVERNGIASNSAITGCCKGRVRTASGYKWMYLEDYEKYIEEQTELA